MNGYQIDWELKVFAILCVFSFLKFFSVSYDNSIHCFLGRSIFFLFHLGFLLLYIVTRKDIDKSQGPSSSKQEAKKKIIDIFKGLAVKALLVLLVHNQAKMMPPLIISCVMGCFTILESKEFLYILQKKFPALVDK